MSQAWLHRQRKQTLLDLSREAGLPQDSGLLKDEILETLNTHLQENAVRLSRVPAFEEYFLARRATPGRPARESVYMPSGDDIEVKSVVKRKGRPAKVKQEVEEENPASSPISVPATVASARNALARVSSALSPSGQLVSRTPAVRRRRSELPGPPSPADVADVVEYESLKFVDNVSSMYARSGITERIEDLRELCSSVTAVQMSFLLLEAVALQKHLMPWRFLVDIPSTVITPSIPVFYPDLFILLTGYYWTTTLLWSSTSIAVPLLFAYFYNLTMRDTKRGNLRVAVARYAADPLMFNVVKGLLTYMVYAKGVNFGIISPEAVDRVDMSLYGGYPSILIGSGVGALAALYEAAQKKAH